MDRECKTCVWSSGPAPGDSNGCVAWKCEYINKREEVTEQTTADEARQFLDDDYHFRSRDFRNYLSEQTMKKMERFEDTETFKDIQKQF